MLTHLVLGWRCLCSELSHLEMGMYFVFPISLQSFAMDTNDELGLLHQPSYRCSLCTRLLPALSQRRSFSIQDTCPKAPLRRLDQRHYFPRWLCLSHCRAHLWRSHLSIQLWNCDCAMDCHGRSPYRLHRYAEAAPAGYQGESPIPSTFLQAAHIDQHAAASLSIFGNYSCKSTPRVQLVQNTD